MATPTAIGNESDTGPLQPSEKLFDFHGIRSSIGHFCPQCKKEKHHPEESGSVPSVGAPGRAPRASGHAQESGALGAFDDRPPATGNGRKTRVKRVRKPRAGRVPPGPPPVTTLANAACRPIAYWADISPVPGSPPLRGGHPLHPLPSGSSRRKAPPPAERRSSPSAQQVEQTRRAGLKLCRVFRPIDASFSGFQCLIFSPPTPGRNEANPVLTRESTFGQGVVLTVRRVCVSATQCLDFRVLGVEGVLRNPRLSLCCWVWSSCHVTSQAGDGSIIRYNAFLSSICDGV